ncbi:hypothetical protein N9D38_00050 [Rubripirellula sp.]|nr:hypothetical protein [Rubripirellula sp.]
MAADGDRTILEAYQTSALKRFSGKRDCNLNNSVSGTIVTTYMAFTNNEKQPRETH